MPKYHYRANNWSDYNKSLVKRGSLTLWLDEKIIDDWYELKQNNHSKPGRPFNYSDFAVEISGTLRAIYRLPLRALQGFIDSLFHLMHLPLRSLSYTQLSRRLKTLPIKLIHHAKGPVHLVVDSTGLKLYGEGEWKSKIHGPSKHRMWRKLHLAVDEKTNEITACQLTPNKRGYSDNKVLPTLLDAYQDEIIKVSADKGYDGYAAFEEIAIRGADPVILPQRKAKVSNRNSVRDKVIQEILELGRDDWKKTHKYHRRSLVETAMFRYKSLFGGQVNARHIESQKREVIIKCNILNYFNSFCKLDSYNSGCRIIEEAP